MFRFIAYILLICLVGCSSPRLLPDRQPEQLPAFFIPEEIDVALVLGSGGVRGMAHIGVIEELINAGVKIDLIVGCSAGSIAGALYADSGDIEAAKAAVMQIRTTNILDINLWNCRYGLSQGHSMSKVLNRSLYSDCFEQLKIPLVVVASDLNTGELVPIGAGNLVEAVRASCSIPLVFVPCEYRGRVLVDGGVVDPVPAKVARDLGAKVIIAVDLCEMLDRTFPTNLFQVASRSAEIAFMWQNQCCCRDADIVIRPKTCDVGCFNDRKKWQIYEAGKRAAREQMPEVMRMIAECKNRRTLERQGRWRFVQPYCYTPEIYLTPQEEILEEEQKFEGERL